MLRICSLCDLLVSNGAFRILLFAGKANNPQQMARINKFAACTRMPSRKKPVPDTLIPFLSSQILIARVLSSPSILQQTNLEILSSRS